MKTKTLFIILFAAVLAILFFAGFPYLIKLQKTLLSPSHPAQAVPDSTSEKTEVPPQGILLISPSEFYQQAAQSVPPIESVQGGPATPVSKPVQTSEEMKK